MQAWDANQGSASEAATRLHEAISRAGVHGLDFIARRRCNALVLLECQVQHSNLTAGISDKYPKIQRALRDTHC